MISDTTPQTPPTARSRFLDLLAKGETTLKAASDSLGAGEQNLGRIARGEEQTGKVLSKVVEGSAAKVYYLNPNPPTTPIPLPKKPGGKQLVQLVSPYQTLLTTLQCLSPAKEIEVGGVKYALAAEAPKYLDIQIGELTYRVSLPPVAREGGAKLSK